MVSVWLVVLVMLEVTLLMGWRGRGGGGGVGREFLASKV